MPAPTIVAQYSTDYTTTGASKNVSISCSAGDTLVVICQGGKNTDLSAASASGISFTGSDTAGNGTFGSVGNYYALNVAAQTNLTVSMSESGGTDLWGFTCFIVRNCYYIRSIVTASTGTGVYGSFFSASYTRTLYLVAQTDSTGADGSSRTWKTVDGTTPTAGNGYELLYAGVDSSYHAYIAYYPSKTLAGKNIALNSPSTTYTVQTLELIGDDDVYRNADGASSHTATSSKSASITIPSTKANYCFIATASVGVQPANGTDTGVTTTMTYGGVSMISAAKIHSNGGSQGYVEVFYLVDPKAGSNTLQLTASTSVDLRYHYTLVGNVDQANPIAEIKTASGSSGTSSVSFTQATSRNAIYTAMVSSNNISSAANSGGGAVVVSGNTSNFNNSSDGGCASSQMIATPGLTQTVGWTLTSGPWAIIALRLAPTSYFQPMTVYGIGL